MASIISNVAKYAPAIATLGGGLFNYYYPQYAPATRAIEHGVKSVSHAARDVAFTWNDYHRSKAFEEAYQQRLASAYRDYYPRAQRYSMGNKFNRSVRRQRSWRPRSMNYRPRYQGYSRRQF